VMGRAALENGADPEEKKRPEDSKPRLSAQALRQDVRFRRLTSHLAALGPRPVGELLIELAEHHGILEDLLKRLEFYYHLPDFMLEACNGSKWPSPPLCVVSGGAP
jgi:hypothetical protein